MASAKRHCWEGQAGQHPLLPLGGSRLLPRKRTVGQEKAPAGAWAICSGDGGAGRLFLKAEELGFIPLGGAHVLSGVWSCRIAIHRPWG